MKPVEFHAAAELELDRAIAFYEEQRAGLGADFQREIEKAVGKIRSFPERYPLHAKLALRRCRIKRFPYSVFYTEFQDRIWIAAIAHDKRRPGYWQPRTPE